MESEPSVLVEPGWLRGNLNRKDLIIADCRYRLTESDFGYRQYSEAHIPGAVFLDINKDLSGRLKEHGGRHPVPDEDEVIHLFEKMGLCQDRTVIAYDDDGSGAARLYWLLKYYGHNDVHILNGGINKWASLGFSLTKRAAEVGECDFKARPNRKMIALMDEVRRGLWKLDLIDCRAERRYLGIEEPIDTKAGHIPGARNIFYQNLLNSDSSFKQPSELKNLLSGISENPVFYCGSGVTSCVSYVAAEILGKKPVLYAGSWSDWISYDDNPIETSK
ncbi:sulfurtransferase [Thermoplasmatales archaeon AK]|nr:sulfurtransferase [Thermoplasmatales archaeon AK]